MLQGTVVDRASGAPVNGARVQVVGDAAAGANSDDAGRYFMRNVPLGSQTVRVTRIGFRPEVQTVTIAANDTATVNFRIAASAVELQQVVVTGTGGAVEKRKIGASIGSMDVAAQQDIMPVNNFSNVLANKVTGVRSVGVGGGVGGGQDLRIRGIASFSLNQRPVIYIDGVRVDSKAAEWTTTTGASTACCSFTGGNSADRLSDINPNDIERVEILKGAAAATLYGSEATNGVIQIFTKKGRGEGKTQWNLGYGTGFNRLRENLPTKEFPRFTGPDGTQAKDANDLIQNGPFNSLDISGQGGTTRSTYFVSALGSKEVGSIQPNDQTKGSLRANVTFVPTDKITVEVRSQYARNKINELQAGNNWTALLGNAMNGNPRNATAERPYGEAWIPVSDIQRMETISDADRWTGGVTLSYAFNPNFTSRLIVGTDAVNEEKSRFFPYAGAYGPAGVTNGQKNLGVRTYRTTTVDYLSNLNFKLPLDIESNLSFGGQGFWESERSEPRASATSSPAPACRRWPPRPSPAAVKRSRRRSTSACSPRTVSRGRTGCSSRSVFAWTATRRSVPTTASRSTRRPTSRTTCRSTPASSPRCSAPSASAARSARPARCLGRSIRSRATARSRSSRTCRASCRSTPATWTSSRK